MPCTSISHKFHKIIHMAGLLFGLSMGPVTYHLNPNDSKQGSANSGPRCGFVQPMGLEWFLRFLKSCKKYQKNTISRHV